MFPKRMLSKKEWLKEANLILLLFIREQESYNIYFFKNWEARKHVHPEKTFSCLSSFYCPIKRHPFTSARITDRGLWKRTTHFFPLRNSQRRAVIFLDLFKLTQSFQSSWTLSFMVSVFQNGGTRKSTLRVHLYKGCQENLNVSL